MLQCERISVSGSNRGKDTFRRQCSNTLLSPEMVTEHNVTELRQVYWFIVSLCTNKPLFGLSAYINTCKQVILLASPDILDLVVSLSPTNPSNSKVILMRNTVNICVCLASVITEVYLLFYWPILIGTGSACGKWFVMLGCFLEWRESVTLMILVSYKPLSVNQPITARILTAHFSAPRW